MPVQLNDPAQLEGAKVIGRDGGKLGKVEAVYLDNATSRPEWVAVSSGFFGSSVSLMPLAAADYDGTELIVPYDKTQLRETPHHDQGAELSPEDEAELYAHYGMDYGGPAGVDPAAGTDDAMTRSEEQMRVGTEQVPTGKARLRKHVVTEQQQVDVPVRHEELRVEREPITEDNRAEARRGPDIAEDEHEVTLKAERPVVATEAEPVERVRIGSETVTEDQQVGGDVRKERIEVDEEDQR